LRKSFKDPSGYKVSSLHNVKNHEGEDIIHEIEEREFSQYKLIPGKKITYKKFVGIEGGLDLDLGQKSVVS